jgi:hypothetical protein
MYALQRPLPLQPLEIAPYSSGRCIEALTQKLQRNEILLSKQVEDQLVAF